MKYPKRAVKMLLALILLAAALLTIWDFSRQTQRALMTETYRTLSEVSKTYSKVFNDRVSATIATMNMMAGHLAAAHDMPKQEIMAILQSAVEEGGFTKMAICGANGVTLSNDGTMVKVSHREYFKKAMAGRADVSDPLTVTANTEESIIISVPIWRQGVVVGALFGGYPLTVAGDHLLDTTYYSQGYGYIISPDGAIILSSDHSDKMVEGKNLLHFFQKTDFTDFSTAALATAMAGGESGSFAYTYHGARRFVSFTPAGINDWYTFSLSSDAPMLRDEKTTTRIVFQLVMKLAVVAALVLAWIVLSNHRHNRQLLRQEEELRLSEKRFSVAINASSGALFELDIRRQLYTHFENAQRIFGVGAETLLEDTRAFSTLPHKEFADAVSRYFFHEDDCPAIQAEMQRLSTGTTASFEARLHRFDHSYLWCRVDLSLIFDAAGSPTHLVGFISDIDTIKTQAILSEMQAQRDPMTGLYNKVAMATLANKGLGEPDEGQHALMVLDIDNFKGINDTLGHAFGDVVLIEVATKLKAAFRSDDIVGRIGGDEFAILMRNVPDSRRVLKKGAELSELFRQTYAGEKQQCKISCSIGIIMADGDSFEALYRKADAALYQAKQNGKNQFVLYRPGDADAYPIDSTQTDDEERENLKKSHTMEAYIFELLYTAKDFDSSIHMALAAIGQQYAVSRVSIFSRDETALRKLYEWCHPGIAATADALSATEGDALLDCFDSSGLLYCNDARELPSPVREGLEGQGVLATLRVTISNDEKIFGFIGFDECNQRRVWTAEEIEKLSFLSKVLSVFLFKKQIEEKMVENLHTHLEILDVLPNYLCVVNPKTHTVEYANRRMGELLPRAQVGAFCFTTLRGGQEGPCESCLLDRIRRGDTDNLEIISEDRQLRLHITALAINWTNDQEMVLLCGTDTGADVPSHG